MAWHGVAWRRTLGLVVAFGLVWVMVEVSGHPCLVSAHTTEGKGAWLWWCRKYVGGPVFVLVSSPYILPRPHIPLAVPLTAYFRCCCLWSFSRFVAFAALLACSGVYSQEEFFQSVMGHDDVHDDAKDVARDVSNRGATDRPSNATVAITSLYREPFERRRRGRGQEKWLSGVCDHLLFRQTTTAEHGLVCSRFVFSLLLLYIRAFYVEIPQNSWSVVG